MKQSKESKAISKINQALGGIEAIGWGFKHSGNLSSDDYAKEAGRSLEKYAKMIKSAVKSLGLKAF